MNEHEEIAVALKAALEKLTEIQAEICAVSDPALLAAHAANEARINLRIRVLREKVVHEVGMKVPTLREAIDG